MSLSDQFKQSYQEAKTNKADGNDDEKVMDNFKTVLSKLSTQLVKDVNSNKIQLYDIKDVRDLAAIITMIKQVDTEGDNKDTPALDRDASSYLIGNLNIQLGSPEGKGDDIDVSQKLEGLSENDVSKLIDSNFKHHDEENVEESK
mgnify:CR=1 FL=1